MMIWQRQRFLRANTAFVCFCGKGNPSAAGNLPSSVSSNSAGRNPPPTPSSSGSTTYTVIKRLAERGVLKNENSIVTTLVSKEEVQCAESREFIDRTFGGSLPGFIAAFTGSKQLSAEEADEIRRMIDSYKEN